MVAVAQMRVPQAMLAAIILLDVVTVAGVVQRIMQAAQAAFQAAAGVVAVLAIAVQTMGQAGMADEAKSVCGRIR